MSRKPKFYPTDPRDEAGDNFAFVKKALTNPDIIAQRMEALAAIKPVVTNTPSPVDILAKILGLSPDTLPHLAGADRLNFWRNGHLNVQVNHGNRAVKLACQTTVSDAQLVEMFSTWKWQRIEPGKLYFRPTPQSVVRL